MSATLEPYQLFGGPMDGARVPQEWVKDGVLIHGITPIPSPYSDLIKQEWAWAKQPSRVQYRVYYRLDGEVLRHYTTKEAA